MRTLSAVLAVLFVMLAGCASTKLPMTPGDPQAAPSYGYHPIDPLPVKLTGPGPFDSSSILNSLPDETMRIAIGEIQADGGITFGPAKAGVAGNSYMVVLDYIKFTTRSLATETQGTQTDRRATRVTAPEIAPAPAPGSKDFATVPVYIGVGLRLTANVTVNSGSVDLGNLFALGVAAQAKQVSGTMVVQTLGIGGESISTIIPMPSEINASTIQNAILALGAIKAKIYDQNTRVHPRVVGVYNTLGGGKETINSFIALLIQGRQEHQVGGAP